MLARSTVWRSLCIPIKGFAVTNVPTNMKSRVCYVCSDKPDSKNEDKSWMLFSPKARTIIFNTKPYERLCTRRPSLNFGNKEFILSFLFRIYEEAHP